MLDDQLLISELAERAGVSVRTIRFYISEGLLPPPQARGRYSVYDEEYLTRIELIKLLKNAYLPLKEIKRMVESLSKEEIESMLDKLSEPKPASPPISPLAPTPAGGITPGILGATPGSLGVTPNSQMVRESGLPEALNYISKLLHSQAAPASRSVPALTPAPPHLPSPVSQPGRYPARARASLDEEDADANTDQPEETGSSWRRYTIKPGVELLVSEQVYNLSAPPIHRIVAQVKQLFSTHPSVGENV